MTGRPCKQRHQAAYTRACGEREANCHNHPLITERWRATHQRLLRPSYVSHQDCHPEERQPRTTSVDSGRRRGSWRDWTTSAAADCGLASMFAYDFVKEAFGTSFRLWLVSLIVFLRISRALLRPWVVGEPEHKNPPGLKPLALPPWGGRSSFNWATSDCVTRAAFHSIILLPASQSKAHVNHVQLVRVQLCSSSSSTTPVPRIPTPLPLPDLTTTPRLLLLPHRHEKARTEIGGKANEKWKWRLRGVWREV